MELDANSVGERMVALWGHDGLRKCPARALRDVAIPDVSQRLLIQFGLPAFWGGWAFFPDVGDNLPRLSADRPHYRLLSGRQVSPSGLSLCLDEKRTGRVVNASQRGDEGEDFVNTDVIRFAAHLILHRKLLGEAAVLSARIKPPSPCEPAPKRELDAYKAAVDQLLDRTELEMRRLDPQVWGGLTGARADFYGEEGVSRFWPCMLGDYGEYSMWSAEEVFRRWAVADG